MQPEFSTIIPQLPFPLPKLSLDPCFTYLGDASKPSYDMPS